MQTLLLALTACRILPLFVAILLHTLANSRCSQSCMACIKMAYTLNKTKKRFAAMKCCVCTLTQNEISLLETWSYRLLALMINTWLKMFTSWINPLKKNQLIVTQTGVKSAFSIEAFGCLKKTKQFYIKNVNVAFFPMIAFQEKLSPILHLWVFLFF